MRTTPQERWGRERGTRALATAWMLVLMTTAATSGHAGTTVATEEPPAAPASPANRTALSERQTPSGAPARSGRTVLAPEAPARGRGPTGPAMAGSRAERASRTRPSGRITERALRRHARARLAVEQRAPEVARRLAQVTNVMRELGAEERQRLEAALRGTGLTLRRFASQHGRIASSRRLGSRLERTMAQLRAPAGAAAGAPPRAGASAAGRGRDATPSGPARGTSGDAVAAPARPAGAP